MRRKLILSTLLLALIAAPLAAKQLPKLEQTRVNLTFNVPSFEGLAARLQALAEKHNGQLTHMSLQSQSTNGNVNMKLSPDQLKAFLQSVNELGSLENQNISTSNNTQSFLDTQNRLQTYQAMSEVNSAKLFAHLPAKQKRLAREEYDRFVLDRIRSYENSLRSYHEQGTTVEISITFQQPAPKPQQSEQQQAENPDQESTPVVAAGVDPTLMKGLYILGIVNLAFLWAFYRRFESSTEESN